MSGRPNIPVGLAAALTVQQISPVFLVEVDWPGGTVYAWNGYAPITFNGHTWLGMGEFGAINPVDESSDGRANGLTITLAGIPSYLITNALANNTQMASVKVYFGVLTGQSFSINPYLLCDGLLDTCTMSDDGQTASIVLNIEKEALDSRAEFRRLTSADQKIDYPADLFLDFVAGLALQQFTWGKMTPGNNAAPPGGGGLGDGWGNPSFPSGGGFAWWPAGDNMGEGLNDGFNTFGPDIGTPVNPRPGNTAI